MIDLKQVIADLTYKPGWSFTYEPSLTNDDMDWWEEGSPAPDMLVIHMTVPNSANPDETMRFFVKRVIPDVYKLEDFLGWWKTIVIEAEIHETREFLRYKGERIDDPHKAQVISKNVPADG